MTGMKDDGRVEVRHEIVREAGTERYCIIVPRMHEFSNICPPTARLALGIELRYFRVKVPVIRLIAAIN